MKKQYIIIIVVLIAVVAFLFMPSKSQAEPIAIQQPKPQPNPAPTAPNTDINGQSVLKQVQTGIALGSAGVAVADAIKDLAAPAAAAVNAAADLGVPIVETAVNTAAPELLSTAVGDAVVQSGGSAAVAAEAAQATASASAAGATGAEAVAAGIDATSGAATLSGSASLGAFAATAGVILAPIAIATILFQTYATDVDKWNEQTHLDELNAQAAADQMARYSVYGAGGSGTSQDPNASNIVSQPIADR